MLSGPRATGTITEDAPAGSSTGALISVKSSPAVEVVVTWETATEIFLSKQMIAFDSPELWCILLMVYFPYGTYR